MAESEKTHLFPLTVVDFAMEHDQGHRDEMEDASYVCKDLPLKGSKCLQSPVHLYAVFDGHSGDKCAKWLEKNLHRFLTKFLKSEVDVGKAIEKAFLDADRELLEENPEIISGSTCIACLLETRTGRTWIANVGDSRCVVSRNGKPVHASVDQKPGRKDEKERIKRAGGFVTGGRIMGFLGVARAFGDAEIKADGCKMLIVDPEIQQFTLTNEDEAIILGCDGLWDVLDNDDVCEYVHECLQKKQQCKNIGKELVRMAIEEERSTDNVSLIIIQLGSGEPS